MNEKDVLGQLRAQGIHDIREVHLALVEHDGSVSVLKQHWAEPAEGRRSGGRAEGAREVTWCSSF